MRWNRIFWVIGFPYADKLWYYSLSSVSEVSGIVAVSKPQLAEQKM